MLKSETGCLCPHCRGTGLYLMPKTGRHQKCYLCMGWRVLSRDRAISHWQAWFGRDDTQAQIERKHYTEDMEWLCAVATGEIEPTHVLLWEQPDDPLDPVTERSVMQITKFIEVAE